MALFKNLTKKKIPTILGLILLIAGLGGGLYLVGRATIIPRASAEETPKEIKITNISENSFSVSWITDIPTSGFVRVGTDPGDLEQTAADERDQLTGDVGSFTTHHASIINLTPSTKYYFKLGSGSSRALFDNGGEPYSLTTAAVLGTPPPADTVYGTVLTNGNAPADGAIVYITLPNASPLSSMVRASGSWAVSLSISRTSDLSAYVTYDRQATVLDIFVQGGQGQVASAITVTANDSPVPPITLGESFDFRSDAPVDQEGTGDPGELPPGADIEGETTTIPEVDNSETEEATNGASSQFSFDSLGPSLPDESTFELAILNPEEEGEEIASSQPQMFGTSPQNVTLTIEVESPTTYTDEVEVAEDGLWQWTPPASLDPGDHSVTVSYTDANGLLQQVQRSFVVLAAGDSSTPSFEASPSAELESTPSVTPSAAPRVSQPSTTSGVPTAGVLTPTIGVFILGAGLLALGLFWQLKAGSLKA